jgi:putative ABC transport system permease protein
MTTTLVPAPRKLRVSDLARLASVGLRTRKLRTGLSALGIAIGVAAIVAVLGLSQSSQAGLLAEIKALGTNLLTVQNGQNVTGGAAELPVAAPAMIARLPGVTSVQDTGAVTAKVYRSPLIPAINTNGLSAGAAQYLGIDRIWPGERIWVNGMWFYVIGILNPAILSPQLDSAVLVGFPAAEKYLKFDGHPSNIYLRAQYSAVSTVDSLLANQANPENPTEAQASQPSAALVAQADAQGALNLLFLGLGAVALLVGAVGVANIMVISVLERRSEIGLRRALGATRADIRIQFLSEAILLALIGGAVGVAAGAAATAIYASTKGWAIVIPPLAWAGGLGAAIVIGAAAGLLPALRAARMSPTQALWSI